MKLNKLYLTDCESKIFMANLSSTKHSTDKYASWLNDPEVNKYLETKEVTKSDLIIYIDEKNKSKDALLLGIFCKTSGNHIGNIKLEPIKNRTATMGIMLGDREYWGKGYGYQASKLLIKYAFNDMQIDCINLGVVSTHKTAIKLYKKLGFDIVDTRIGVLKNNQDQIVMELKKI